MASRKPGTSSPPATRSHDSPPFHDVLVEQIRKTPWLLVSLVLHLVVLVVAALVVRESRPAVVADKPVSVDLVRAHVEDPIELPPPALVPDEPPTSPSDADVDFGPEARPNTGAEEPTGDGQSPWVGGGDGGDRDGTGTSLDPDAPFQGGPHGGTDVSGTANGKFGHGGGHDGGIGGRAGGHGNRSGPGMKVVNEAVDWGLQWLASHQNPDGSWSSADFTANCKTNQCTGRGNPSYDAGVSGLALLAFLGAGFTTDAGPYKQTMQRGLRALGRMQDPEGCFGSRASRNFTYGHAICTLAMTEAYALTHNGAYRDSAQRGIDFIGACKNPYKAWRYGVRPGENDVSVTGWMVMALKSATLAGLEFNPTDLKDALAFIDETTDSYGRTGYTMPGNGPVRTEGKQEEFPSENSEAMTAVAVLCRIFMGEDPTTSDKVKKGVGLMAKKLPAWEKPKLDFYYWYYGTLAMYQAGGSEWREWNEAMRHAILDRMRKDGDEKGSWDPDDCWGEEGGRVYSTALLTMCLEVYYRYDRVFGTRTQGK
jgi:hypothetical protein